jgi:hypothetical protein
MNSIFSFCLNDTILSRPFIFMLIGIVVLGCDSPDRSISSTQDSSNYKVHTPLTIFPDTGTGTPNVDTGSGTLQQVHSEQKTVVEEPELYVVRREAKTNVNFEPYYVFEVKNNRKLTLLSFKFKFSYTLAEEYQIRHNFKDFVVIKQSLEPGEITMFNVSEPSELKTARDIGIITSIHAPFLSAAVDVDGNTIMTREGANDEYDKLIKRMKGD